MKRITAIVSAVVLAVVLALHSPAFAANLTSVGVTSGVPTSGTGTVSTLDNLIGTAGSPSSNVQSFQGVSGGTPAPISAASLPLPTGAATSANQTAAGSDGSTTITTGGTAQNLFSGATPTHGWEVCNPNISEDAWLSQSTTAAINGEGSLRVAADGGCVDSPRGMSPFHAISIIAATTGHALTAVQW